MLQTLRRQQCPMGRGLTQANFMLDGPELYGNNVRDVKIIELIGKPGALVIFGLEELIKLAAHDGRFGADGTHNLFFPGRVEVGLSEKMECLMFVFKDEQTGRTATFLRMLCTFKCEKVRIYFFVFAFRLLKK
mmetsp:Transcript_11094/g.29234  ORF Transcript_11094/g.29234 Transcript_11094/m.29234 type:complete len:133 (+) Transcript_11094:561-959(+)